MLGSNRAEKLTRHALSKKNVSHILKDKNTNEEVKLKIKKNQSIGKLFISNLEKETTFFGYIWQQY